MKNIFRPDHAALQVLHKQDQKLSKKMLHVVFLKSIPTFVVTEKCSHTRGVSWYHISKFCQKPSGTPIHWYVWARQPSGTTVHWYVWARQPLGTPVQWYMWARQPSGTPVHWCVWARQPLGTPVQWYMWASQPSGTVHLSIGTCEPGNP